jgi:membrane protease YdiL (CAAX protease family)
MIGILVQIGLSWLFLRLVEKKDLSVLGYRPFPERIAQFSIGVVFAGTLCAVIQIVDSWLTHLDWEINSALSVNEIAESLWWNLKSVLFEEFIFRGALLYIAVQRLGARKGIILSAINFGVYHWFSYGIIGDPAAMTIVFAATTLWGLVWAYSFSATHSMALSVGLHFGWNFTFNSIFSRGPLGSQLLIPVESDSFRQLSGVPSLLNFLLPIILVAILSYWLARRLGERHQLHHDP